MPCILTVNIKSRFRDFGHGAGRVVRQASYPLVVIVPNRPDVQYAVGHRGLSIIHLGLIRLLPQRKNLLRLDEPGSKKKEKKKQYCCEINLLFDRRLSPENTFPVHEDSSNTSGVRSEGKVRIG